MCDHGTTAVVEIGGVPRDVDTCIAPLVRALNAAGAVTVASCCGHGRRPGSIALADGREMVLARTYEEARSIDGMFPDIHGERAPDSHARVTLLDRITALEEGLREACELADCHIERTRMADYAIGRGPTRTDADIATTARLRSLASPSGAPGEGQR